MMRTQDPPIIPVRLLYLLGQKMLALLGARSTLLTFYLNSLSAMPKVGGDVES